MTAEEMNARKLNIIRFLLKEDLTEEKLQLFENTREMQEQYRQQMARLHGDEEMYSRLEEPKAEYNSAQSTATESRITELINYLLNEVPDDEELFGFESLCNDRKPPCRFTIEELQEELRLAEEEFERGDFIYHEDIKRKTIPS